MACRIKRRNLRFQRRYFTLLSSWQLCCVEPKYQSPHFEQPDTAKPKATISKARVMKRMSNSTPHASAVHSISMSNAIGQDATGTNVRVGGLTAKKRP